MKSEIPEFVRDGLTSRQWKSLKRKQLRAVHRALDDYRLGCAYAPELDEVTQIQRKLDFLKHKLSTKEWGR